MGLFDKLFGKKDKQEKQKNNEQTVDEKKDYEITQIPTEERACWI